ncbi:hypothetical protein OH76DRAFT_1415411 [Lentinus brumalis]|uniref:Uncharacterized protein n=1 Tax=Lentinus brumalis TaxID=2498619 RepID=A0A371DQ45_9APHY|nr:hypothetical protein OH76DRAFT_1415411 [Polyporus brumalis]
MSLPSTLPSKETTLVIEKTASNDAVASLDGLRAGSVDSGPLWSAVGSPPRLSPALAQFDECESRAYEDGEVQYVADEEAPPANQEALWTETANGRSRVQERYERYEASFSEFRRPLSLLDDEPTARKRSWAGSTRSEEDRRSARRPRIADRSDDSLPKLPSIREMVGNPWSGLGGEGVSNLNFLAPVSTSTPVPRPSYARDRNSYQHDDCANLSGHPPTLRGASIDSSPTSSDKEASELRTREQSRARSSTDPEEAAMEVDAGLVGNSLLERPMGRQGRGREEPRSGSVGPWNLRSTRTEFEAGSGAKRDRIQEEFWRGGYRPNGWNGEEARTDATEREGYEHERAARGSFRESRRSHFSALPHTKAWEFTHGTLGRAQPGSEDRVPRMVGQRASCMEEEGGPGCPRSEYQEDTSHDWRAGRDQDEDDASVCDEGAVENEGRNAPHEWWQDGRTSRLPTMLMREEEAEDVPTVAKNPHSDPEEQYAGMSREWMKAIWMNDEPVLLLTVFNYKFTKNQEINRHIETSISAATMYLTGATGFHVVPPDPEWRYEIRARDLPYLWVIRGLPEAAVWEMVKFRVVSARGVSFITHPKSISNPRFVCGLAGFLRPDVKATKAAVLDILESEYMKSRLTDMVHDLDEWREWAEEMRGCRYNVFLNGTGAARKVFWCGGCRGVDHEEQECPFPKMKGWKGPLAGERSHSKYWGPEASISRNPSRGRGTEVRFGGSMNMRTPTSNGRGMRGGWPGSGSGRARGGHRGGFAPRNAYGQRDFSSQRSAFTQHGTQKQRGGMRGDWPLKTPTRFATWGERY